MPAVGLKGPSAFIVMDHQALSVRPSPSVWFFSDLPSIGIAHASDDCAG
jgi:hypothetical protein